MYVPRHITPTIVIFTISKIYFGSSMNLSNAIAAARHKINVIKPAIHIFKRFLNKTP